MLLVKTYYTDEDLAQAINVSLSTLKNKRKITEQRHLKDYEWSRNKKEKLYTIHSYKHNVERDSLNDTFESLIADFCKNKVPLENLEKALKIFIILYKTDENFPATLALYADESPKEINRYTNKFKKLGLLVEGQYDYFLINDVDWKWEKVTKEEYENVKSYWKRIFFRQTEIRNLSPSSRDKEKIQACRDIASSMTVEEFGFTRKVTHKTLTDQAEKYFKPFLEYANKVYNLFAESKPESS